MEEVQTLMGTQRATVVSMNNRLDACRRHGLSFKCLGNGGSFSLNALANMLFSIPVAKTVLGTEKFPALAIPNAEIRGGWQRRSVVLIMEQSLGKVNKIFPAMSLLSYGTFLCR